MIFFIWGRWTFLNLELKSFLWRDTLCYWWYLNKRCSQKEFVVGLERYVSETILFLGDKTFLKSLVKTHKNWRMCTDPKEWPEQILFLKGSYMAHSLQYHIDLQSQIGITKMVNYLFWNADNWLWHKERAN